MKKNSWKWINIGVVFVLCIVSCLLYVHYSFASKEREEIQEKTDNYRALRGVSPRHATVFFGDSITERCPLEDLYAEYTKKSGIPVINRGISSEKTDTMLTRIQETVLDIEPRNIVMLMGINDFLDGVDNETIKRHIQEMIKITKRNSRDTTIILSSVYPINVAQRTSLQKRIQMIGKDTQNINALNRMLKVLAKEEQIVFLDLDELLKDETGNLKSEYAYDGLHPNTEGYLALRDLIVSVLR